MLGFLRYQLVHSGSCAPAVTRLRRLSSTLNDFSRIQLNGPPFELFPAGRILLYNTRLRVTKAGVAQVVEQRIRNAWVGGSNPSTGTK